MSKVELFPINKGNPFAVDDTKITIIGRSPQTGCCDNKISRNHAQLYLKSDGTLWIKSIHQNPTFYKTKTNQIVSLSQNKEYQLNHNDQFGLLPNEYFYRVSIMSKDVEEKANTMTNSSTIPKSPIKASEQTATLSIDKSNPSTTIDQNNLTRSLTNTSLSTEERTPIEEIVDDKNDGQSTTAPPTTEQASASNNNDEIDNQPSTSTVIHPKRERCPYGTSCYRTNPIHRQEAIHPDDSDWDSDGEEDAVSTTTKPVCPYGKKCYRTNPDHLNEYDHSKPCSSQSKKRTRKHRTFDYDDDDDEDDDGDVVSSETTTDDQETDSDDDNDDGDEWKPDKDPRYLAETDDESTDESDKELGKKEAEEFIRGSTADRNGRIIKKPRVDNE